MPDDEVKKLAEKLGDVDATRPPRYEIMKVFHRLSPRELEALARVALEFCEERITETVNAYLRAINKMYAIEAEKLITGELKIETEEKP